MNKHTTLLFLLLYPFCVIRAQITTANDQVTPYEGHFRAGSNFGLYAGFTDEMLGTLAGGDPTQNVAGVGAKALRPGLFEHFTQQWGYDLRLPTFQHYKNIGLEDHTLMVGFPAEAHRDSTAYCAGVRSELFAQLYEPIWDDGTDGTPINEDNYYAAYLYKVVTKYQDYVRFYEIWNEPGFDYTGAEGWLLPGQAGNWWDSDPDPCSYKLRAPIYHYIRLLRISWEVIKRLDPDAYIVVSGVGFPSFLDAILRNTDNPDAGQLSADYPLKGGAYFDVLGMHAYPHFDGSLRAWNDEIGWFEHFRHSDAAAQGLVRRKNMMQEVLSDHGYDGITFPKKLSTITECNVPRRAFQEFIGGTEAQRNFMMKAVATCMQNEIHQLHVFQISERAAYEEAQSEFDVMGLYKQFDPALGLHQTPTEAGIALRTTTELLFGKRFDAEKTAALQLGDSIGGGAFTDEEGGITYMLWAKTHIDREETSLQRYEFPSQLRTENWQMRSWDFTENFEASSIDLSQVMLTQTPIFLIEQPIAVDFLSSCVPGEVIFEDKSRTATSWLWTFEGGTPASSTERAPTVNYAMAGQYNTTLIARDANDQIVTRRSTIVSINRVPQAAFSSSLLGASARFSSQLDPAADTYLWEFGDGATSTLATPNHTFARSGTYEVRLTVGNECGTTTATQTIVVNSRTTSRLTYSANDSIPNYPVFRPGVNLNYYPNWTDEQLADIAAGNPLTGVAGAGIRSLRTSLPDEFVDFWGYDIRRNTFEHYEQRGLEDNSLIIGFPAESHRSEVYYCPTQRSALFKNMYLDIWDNGANGTAINDDNDYARYLYELVLRYRDQTTFWEIWNAPDLTNLSDVGWNAPGEPGNWWDSDPDPCAYGLHAPIEHYVRLLRISYEIIKTYDPDAFVTISGIAFPAFLDAVCRNTDNPADGGITDDYPLRGGAYFDAVGYVAFPHLDGSVREYDHSIQTFRFNRNSDAAIRSIGQLKSQMEAVLEDYGYGALLPAKAFLVSRSNVPRRARGDFLGGDELQRNFLIKSYVEAVKQQLLRFHVYQISETAPLGSETSELELMGLYEYLVQVPYSEQRLTMGGIGFKTAANLLEDKTYVPERSEETADYSIQAFVDADGFHTYVAWAKTKNDQSEVAAATYQLPSLYNIDSLEQRSWNFAVSPQVNTIGTGRIELTGTPTFLTEKRSAPPAPVAAFVAATTVGCPGMQVDFLDVSQHATAWEWTFEGGEPSQSTAQHPTVIYPDAGTFAVTLKVTNETGQNMLTEQDFVLINELPIAEFELEITGAQIQLTNRSIHADSYFWSFGDGFTSMRENPVHDYLEDGFYAVQLIAENAGCRPDTFSQNIVIERNAVVAVFGVDNTSGCPGVNINFVNQSINADRIEWLFPGGTPAASGSPTPQIQYNHPGQFAVSLVAINGLERDTVTQENAIEIRNAAIANFSYTVEGSTVSFRNLSQHAEQYFWEFGDGQTSTLSDPVHQFTIGQTYNIRLTVDNEQCAPHVFERRISFAEYPIAQFSTSDNVRKGCLPLTLQFINQSEYATDVQWSFPGGTPAFSNEENPIVTYYEPGFFDVGIEVSNALGDSRFNSVNYVRADTGAIADFAFVADGARVEFVNNSKFATNYEWDFGTGATSTATDTSFTFAENGTYDVQLAAYYPFCGWDTIVRAVRVNAPPIARFRAENSADCVPVVTLVDESRYQPISYRWFFPSGIPSRSEAAEPVVRYFASGTYEAVLIVENEAGRDTTVQQIEVQADEFYHRTYTFCDNEPLTLNGQTYDGSEPFATQVLNGQHGDCDTTLSLHLVALPTYSTRQTVTIFDGEFYTLGGQVLRESGRYTELLSTAEGCDSLVTIDLRVRPQNEGLGTAEGKLATWQTDLVPQVFPSPFRSHTRLSFWMEQPAKIDVQVIDEWGRVVQVLAKQEMRQTGTQQIDWQPTADLPKGIYWIQLRVGEVEKWSRVVWL